MRSQQALVLIAMMLSAPLALANGSMTGGIGGGSKQIQEFSVPGLGTNIDTIISPTDLIQIPEDTRQILDQFKFKESAVRSNDLSAQIAAALAAATNPGGFDATRDLNIRDFANGQGFVFDKNFVQAQPRTALEVIQANANSGSANPAFSREVAAIMQQSTQGFVAGTITGLAADWGKGFVIGGEDGGGGPAAALITDFVSANGGSGAGDGGPASAYIADFISAYDGSGAGNGGPGAAATVNDFIFTTGGLGTAAYDTSSSAAIVEANMASIADFKQAERAQAQAAMFENFDHNAVLQATLDALAEAGQPATDVAAYLPASFFAGANAEATRPGTVACKVTEVTNEHIVAVFLATAANGETFIAPMEVTHEQAELLPANMLDALEESHETGEAVCF